MKPELTGEYMKVLFIGLGSIGTKHASIIHRLFPDYELFALRSEPTSATIQLPYVTNLYDWNDCDEINFDVAFICNPTHLHIKTAIKCAMNKMHLFIEKPLCNTLDDLFELLLQVNKNNLTAYVAYPFRFNKKILSEYNSLRLFAGNCASVTAQTNIERWGKQSYSFNKKYGGGVLWELSHELDLLQWLYGDIISFRCNLLKHDKYNIYESARINLVHSNSFQSKLYLSLIDDYEFRRIEYGHLELYYKANEQMYENQIKYFFNNLNNPLLKNNIFEASKLLKLLVDMENDN